MAEDDGRSGQRDWGGDTASLGGYGSAGLFSRRRQMERTQGGSYQNLSNVSRAQARGGYASMPGQGPAPLVTEPKISGHTGPSGPTKMAQGVAPDYTGRIPDTPNWGQTSRLLGRAGGAALAKGLLREKREKVEPTPIEKVTEFVKENKYDPSLGGSGASINDINLKFGLPVIGAAGEVEGPRPSAESQWREPESGGTPPSYEDIATRRLGSEPIPQGSIRFAGELEQVAGVRREQPVTEAPQPRRTPPGTGRAVSPRTTAGTEAEPRVAEMSSGYEYPGYNPRLGAQLGRTATRGERRATRDPNQMGLFDPNV